MRANSGVQRLTVALHVVRGDAESVLDLDDSIYGGTSLVIELAEDLVSLGDLVVESGVLSLLALLRLVDDVFQDVGLLL